MTDNFASIHQLLRDNLEQYEKSREGVPADPHQRVLAALEHPYMTMPNHDEFLSALRQELTQEEVDSADTATGTEERSVSRAEAVRHRLWCRKSWRCTTG